LITSARNRRGARALALALTALSLAISLSACGQAARSPGVASPGSASAGGQLRAGAASLLRWSGFRHVSRVLDLAGPRSDGRIVVATAGRLALLGVGGRLQPFARGARGYSGSVGLEPYIAVSTGRRDRSAGCGFGLDVVYALRLDAHPGVTAVDAKGVARPFVSLPGGGLENGIAFDETGRFANRLLVTSVAKAKTTVYAIDCRGRVATITRGAPRVEGGIAVAPASFGRFAGDLIAPDEIAGKVYAIAPNGRSTLVADSGVAHGQDIGVESGAFVPAGFGARWTALLSDRLTPRNPHPGDDLVLSLKGAPLMTRARVHPGDLLLAGEGGGATIDIACARSCRVREVATGPKIAHIEGHIAFIRS
jgi:hypothetical protein